MSIHYRSDDVLVWHGDSLALMRELDDGCMDAVVTDPPYALEFMGKVWDRFDKGDAPGSFQHWVELWAREALRILKPGGHLLAFGGTRTFHRLTAGIEDAGFEIRDSIAWLYGSGFPKSLDVGKAIDKAAGAERETIGFYESPEGTTGWKGQSKREVYGPSTLVDGERRPLTAPATADAARWNGWGTALKPAFEPIVVARKPLGGNTVAANVLAYGTGALNIDGSRIAGDVPSVPQPDFTQVHGRATKLDAFARNGQMSSAPGGRWPANVVLDASQAAALDAQSGVLHARGNTTPTKRTSAIWGNTGPSEGETDPGDSGGASRFFYVAKASRRERPKVGGSDHHPTVKPLTLIRHLVKLVTPPDGTVLDPFAGSGTTVEACLLEGFRCMAMEREADYLPLIAHRIERARQTT